MKPIVLPHSEFQAFLEREMRENNLSISQFPTNVQLAYEHVYSLDLSSVDKFMRDKYSNMGPMPRLPSSMLRSMVVMVLAKIPRFTQWVDLMRTAPIYAILSGFPPENVPGVGTFYDFMHRLWDGSSPNFSENTKTLPMRVKKPKGQGKKADPIEKETVAELILRLSAIEYRIDQEAFATLFKIFSCCFLDISIRNGLVSPDSMTVAGDGTAVVTAARFRSHRICDCAQKGITNCECKRYFSQPDTNVGWDSSRDMFYAGYDLYLLTDASNDLPLFPFLNQASCHDSHGFCHAFFRFKSYLPDLMPSSLLLDSAHDSMAMHHLCRGLNITPYIDLNLSNTKKTDDYHGVTLDSDGVPICQAGHRMKSNGNDLVRQYAKFRCPLNSNGTCNCENPCSDAKYGRTCSVPLSRNIRLYTTPPRGSDEYISMYNKRTASERCNKRMKNDFLLELGHHRKTMFWYIRIYVIMMVQHLSAWVSAA